MALGRFTVHAGDFRKGNEHQFLRGKLLMKKPKGFFRETVRLDAVESVEVASEESVKRLGGTIGWGVAGAVLLGPVGLLAGLLAGGRGKDVTFVCKLKDGRKFLATASSKMFVELQAMTFR
ncbi:hypothetical protein [Microvirga alba]|uniref:Uncharacterized protein n=1 Tax=Microvirga alba TaxID=2791025 RepID=A0A931BRK3_9HYPH|nr:hypothetical protein [Microvirga alba]MBF9235631.1 hypothetical protein [Microvirga alba]